MEGYTLSVGYCLLAIALGMLFHLFFIVSVLFDVLNLEWEPLNWLCSRCNLRPSQTSEALEMDNADRDNDL